jgi:hypothetical protein
MQIQARLTGDTSSIPVMSPKLVVNTASGILSSFFDDLNTRLSAAINGAIQNASDNAERLIVQSGEEINLAIQNAMEAYKDNMELTIDKLDQSIQDVLNQLQTMVGQIESKSMDALGKITQASMDIISTLPFADKQTRFTKVSPQYIAISDRAATVKVSMIGLFLFAEKHIPTLSIQNSRCTVLGIGTTKIDFEVPVTSLVDQIDSPTRTFTYVKGVFNAPWDSGWVLSKIEDAQYPLYLNILPSTPGPITITYKCNSTDRITQNQQSQSYYVGADHRGPTIHPSMTYYPTPGFKYSATPGVTIESHIGHVVIQSVIMSPNSDQCVVTFELGGGDWDNVGRVNYHLNWQEYKDVQAESIRTEVVNDLFWGNTKLFAPGTNEKIEKIHFDAYDGTSQDFFPITDTSKRFIKIVAQNGQVLITAQAPNGDESDLSATLKPKAESVSSLVSQKEQTSVKSKDSIATNVYDQIKESLRQRRIEIEKEEAALKKSKLDLETGLKQQVALLKTAKTLREVQLIRLDHSLLQTENAKKASQFKNAQKELARNKKELGKMEYIYASALGFSFNPLDPIGSILDSAMDSIENKLDDAVNKAHDAASDLLTQAGEQAMRVIASLKGAYLDSLEATYEKADQLLRENIDRVTDLVNTILTGEQDALLKVADKIQDIVKLSALSNWWIPLLSNTSPEFTAVNADPMDPTKPWTTKVLITFTGNFAYSDRSDFTPSFVLDGKEFGPIMNNSKVLKFAVDISNMDPSINVSKYSYLNGALNVMWLDKDNPLAKKTSVYRTLLGILPSSPGKIKIQYTTPPTVIKKTLTSGQTSITRDTDHWETHTFNLYPEAGWHLVPGSASIRWTDGPYSQCNAGIVSADNDMVHVTYSFKNGSGKFVVDYIEQQDVPAKTRTEERNDLRWGSSFIATPQAGESITQIDFDAFNGDHAEFQPRTDDSNPFIELREFQNTIQIKAKNASDLNDNNFVGELSAKTLSSPTKALNESSNSSSSTSSKLPATSDTLEFKEPLELKV